MRSTATNNAQMSEHLQQAIEAGEVLITEEPKSAVLHTAWPEAQQYPTQEHPAPVVMASGRMVGLQAELEMLGYKVETENTQVALFITGQCEETISDHPQTLSLVQRSS